MEVGKIIYLRSSPQSPISKHFFKKWIIQGRGSENELALKTRIFCFLIFFSWKFCLSNHVSSINWLQDVLFVKIKTRITLSLAFVLCTLQCSSDKESWDCDLFTISFHLMLQVDEIDWTCKISIWILVVSLLENFLSRVLILILILVTILE